MAGWFEPLSIRIVQKDTAVLFPAIEVIDAETLGTSANTNVGQNGVFRFVDLTFQWQKITDAELKRRSSSTDPIRFLILVMGLFHIYH